MHLRFKPIPFLLLPLLLFLSTSWPATADYSVGSKGNTIGATSAADNAVPRFNGTSGKLLQDSGILIDDDDALDLPELGSAPANPAASRFKLYFRAGALYFLTTGGVESAVGGGGTPTDITVADAAGDTTTFPALFGAATGDLGPLTDAGLSYNATTNVLTAGGFSGPLTGNVTGDLTGNADTATLADTVTTNANLTGDVTSSGNATTIADDAVTYAKIQDVSATSRLLGRTTAGAGVVEEVVLDPDDTLAADSDSIVPTQQAVKAYVDANAGSADANPATAGGRLTTVSATPIQTSDTLGAGTLYYTPFISNQLSLRPSGTWTTLSFSETSLSLTGLTADTNYDVFGYSNAGTLAMEALSWSTATARATEVVYQDGVLVKSGDATRRLLGTIRINSTGGQVDWALSGIGSGGKHARIHIWNAANRRPVFVFTGDSDNSWTQTAANAWRAANNSSTHRTSYVQGLADEPLSYSYTNRGNLTSSDCSVGVGLDSTSAAAANSIISNTSGSTSNLVPATGRFDGYTAIGYHFFAPLEYANGTNTIWYGDNGSPTKQQWGTTFVGWF
jgi:hypothetical protein